MSRQWHLAVSLSDHEQAPLARTQRMWAGWDHRNWRVVTPSVRTLAVAMWVRLDSGFIQGMAVYCWLYEFELAMRAQPAVLPPIKKVRISPYVQVSMAHKP